MFSNSLARRMAFFTPGWVLSVCLLVFLIKIDLRILHDHACWVPAALVLTNEAIDLMKNPKVMHAQHSSTTAPISWRSQGYCTLAEALHQDQTRVRGLLECCMIAANLVIAFIPENLAFAKGVVHAVDVNMAFEDITYVFSVADAVIVYLPVGAP